MSVQLNPENSSNSPQRDSSSKLNSFLHRWIDSIYDGYQKEILPSEQYCQRVWSLEKGPGSIEPKHFMRSCKGECAAHSFFAHWSRLN